MLHGLENGAASSKNSMICWNNFTNMERNFVINGSNKAPGCKVRTLARLSAAVESTMVGC